jgi:hypothetical protein
MISDILIDILVFGLWDGIAFLFSGKKTYKFIVSSYKNGKKFRVSSVYFKKKEKYRIRIEELRNGKFYAIQKGTFADESVIEGFHTKQLQPLSIAYNQHEYDKLKLSELKSVLDTIGWNDTK